MLALAAGCGRVDFGEAARLAQFSSRGDHGCGLTEPGEVGCWGRGDFGQLGVGDLPAGSVARLVDTPDPVDRVATGEETSCLLAGGDAHCFGRNNTGQVPGRTEPQVRTPVRIEAGAKLRSVEMGQHGTLAITEEGTVRYWGGNNCGLAGGTGRLSLATPPVEVPVLAGVTDIALTDAFACAVIGDGSIWCWGGTDAAHPEDNACNADGDAISPPTLSLAPTSPVVDIDGGCHDHVCAVLADGTVWCRGSNFDGQLGDGTLDRQKIFVKVLGIDDAIAVGVGAFHTCALRRDGEVSCWGKNDRGQLGLDEIGGGRKLATPAVAMPAPMDDIEGGCAHTCAQSGASLWCWGSGNALQLGNGAIGDSAVPVPAWRGPDPL